MFASVAMAAVTVVFVHGAFADGSSWSKVIANLQKKNIETVSVQNPLSSLADDVAATRRAIANVNGPIVLVGHSWGGVVVTEAGDDPKVKALVYVDAFAPPAGVSVNDLGKGSPPPEWQKNVIASKDGYLTLPEAVVENTFAQDLPKSQARLLAATQGPSAARLFEDKTTTAAWMTRPSWYIIGANDRMIAPDAQRAMAKAIKAHVTELQSSHVPMISQPDRVTAVIESAISSVSPATTAPSGQ